MSKKYEAPIEVRELEKLINSFTYKYGLDVRNVFRDLLRYIVIGFSLPDTQPLTEWRYTQEQNKAFYEMFATWIKIMDTQIKIKGYYDAFGELFMAMTSQRRQQEQGQFFTPDEISALCRDIVMGKEKDPTAIYDPAVGSGRMLISTKVNNPKNYLVGFDIDYTCCLMCVCNFLINSCVGEVVCIDSLLMNNFRGAWLVNEAYYRTELPSIRWMNEQEYIKFKQAKLPAHIFFLDKKGFDQYINMSGLWAKMPSLFNNTPQRPTKNDVH